MSHKRIHVFYTGRVQGVGFRYTVQNFAVQLGLTGWVKNLPNGGVEMVAEGQKEVLERLLNMLKADMERYIEKETVEWEERGEGFKGFGIRFY